MSPLFKKLNLKDPREIVVLNAPPAFEPALAELDEVAVRRDLAGAEAEFVIAFVTRQAEVNEIAARMSAHTAGDAVVWFAYPKGTSKRYTCDFNRDTGWDALGRAGFEPVRQVAIDEDWSALRFRRVAFIRQMKRDPKRAMTAAGKEKAAKEGRA